MGYFLSPRCPLECITWRRLSPASELVKVTNVNASVGQTTSITVKMEVGDVTQQVNVIGRGRCFEYQRLVH